MKQNINRVILAEAAYYNSNISQLTLQVWADEFLEIGPEKLRESYKNLRPGRKMIPSPADVFAAVSPSASTDVLANEAASRIIESVSKFGWNNIDAAREYIGGIGWAAVERFGGWVFLCENLGVSTPISVFYAQARDIAKSQIELAKVGLNNAPPELPAPQSKSMDLIGSHLLTMKQIPKG